MLMQKLIKTRYITFMNNKLKSVILINFRITIKFLQHKVYLSFIIKLINILTAWIHS